MPHHQQKPIKLLVDNSVLSFGIVADGITVPVSGMVNRLLLIQARPARTGKEKWLQKQIECLPTISRLAREARLQLRSYEELTLEAWKRPGSFPAQPFGDVFRGNDITAVPSAVRRGLFFQSDMGEHIKASSLVAFCKWLLDGYSEEWLKAPYVRDKLTEFERTNLRNIDRFKIICRSLSEKQYGDGFHLWTGEVNSLSYFLTADGKFIRAVTNQGKLAMPCRPISASDLLDELGVTERDALPFKYGRRYTLGGIPYDE